VVARFDSTGASVETAFVLGEFYRRQGAWKFRAVGQGYSSGLEGLATDFGITVDEPQHAAPPAAPARTPSATAPVAPPPPAAPTAAPVRLTKVTLTKAAPTVSLTKQGGTSGALRVNLNWEVRKQFSGWGSKLGRAVAMHSDLDLDLCALYELADGSKGVVQALGNAFGSLHHPPYIHLDGDDRTGAVTTGENLTVNLDYKDAFRRIMVFVTIYEGARSFADLHATVTLQPQHGAAVDFSLDECTVPSPVCALALITNTGGDLIVQREARYLIPERGVSPQRTVDHAYGWGMNWTPGRK
jgi:tellurite resistance protein TerA